MWLFMEYVGVRAYGFGWRARVDMGVWEGGATLSWSGSAEHRVSVYPLGVQLWVTEENAVSVAPSRVQDAL
jgi:hypothetical protein